MSNHCRAPAVRPALTGLLNLSGWILVPSSAVRRLVLSATQSCHRLGKETGRAAKTLRGRCYARMNDMRTATSV
jgi:hypothetical protein